MTNAVISSPNKLEALKLNQDQEKALEKLDKWILDKDEQHATLSGAGGTGKTFCIARWAKQQDNIVFIAPTHKARKVLERGLKNAEVEDPKCLTIAQALGKQPTLDDNGQEKWLSNGRTLLDGQLVVVDEASMVAAADFVEISQKASKVLWIGDYYQLPPINESRCEAFSTGTVYNGELTQQMRNFGHLADTCQQIRNAIITNTPLPRITEASSIDIPNGGIEFLSRSELEYNFISGCFTSPRFEADSSFGRILAFRNRVVEAHNQAIKPIVYNSKDEWLIGQRLLCYSPVQRAAKNSKRPKILATNSEELLVTGKPKQYTISKLDLKHEPPIVRRILEGLSAFALEVETEAGFEITLRIATPQSKAKVEQIIASIRKQATLSRIDKVCLGILYRFFDNVKDIFASTVHKAQGSTYEYVFLDLADIEACRDHKTKARLLYTAMSRASRKVYVFCD